MNLIHIGAENCVTGSCHLVQAKAVTLLVDCGVTQGHDPVLPFREWPVAAADIDYLFLTHAHIDHIGRVPDLIDAGFKGEIICTHATKALLIPMLRDGMSFSSRTDSQIRAMEARIDDLTWGFEMYDTFHLKKGITFQLKNAGHILGSCFIQFSFPRPDGSAKQVTFSGDLGCTDTPILPDPDLPDACDLLVLESTYGDRNHEHRAGTSWKAGPLQRQPYTASPDIRPMPTRTPWPPGWLPCPNPLARSAWCMESPGQKRP